MPASPSGANDKVIVKVMDDGFNWITGTWESLRADAAGLAVDAVGNILFSDLLGQRIAKITATGQSSTFLEYAPQRVQASSGLVFSADGLLYSCEQDRIVAYPPQGKGRVISRGIQCQDLAVTNAGTVYFTDPQHHSIGYVDRSGHKKKEDLPMFMVAHPNGLRLSPDQSLLFVDDPNLRWVWSFQVQVDGSLRNAEPFYHLETRDDSSRSGAAGMTVDSLGYLYVATRLGIQVCDQPGRVVAIINPPDTGPVLGVAFGGADLQDLYVDVRDKLYRRHLLRKGVLPGVPQKPPVPQL